MASNESKIRLLINRVSELKREINYLEKKNGSKAKAILKRHLLNSEWVLYASGTLLAQNKKLANSLYYAKNATEDAEEISLQDLFEDNFGIHNSITFEVDMDYNYKGNKFVTGEIRGYVSGMCIPSSHIGRFNIELTADTITKLCKAFRNLYLDEESFVEYLLDKEKEFRELNKAIGIAWRR